jgi:hypothetical protein
VRFALHYSGPLKPNASPEHKHELGARFICSSPSYGRTSR